MERTHKWSIAARIRFLAMAVPTLFALAITISASAWANFDLYPPSTSTSPVSQAAHFGAKDSYAPAQPEPILGAALIIISDGTAPWEDRPLAVPGMGTLPGTFGVADPGDDTGPVDRIVRSWDTVTYRVAISIRDAAADDIVAEVTLTGPVVWDAQQVVALELSACPGGATLHDGGLRLRCLVGDIDAPPAKTIALDLTARVSGSAPHGGVITASATVRSPGITPDPDAARCPVPQVDGCDAAAPDVTTSSAPAAELRKNLVGVDYSTIDGVLGRAMTWRLDVVFGADGDVRGTSNPVGAPWPLPDWWLATGRGGAELDLPVELVGCTDVDGGADWSCAQPGGPGTPLDVVIEALDLAAVMTDRLASTLPKIVGSLEVELWAPEARILATEWDVTLKNCFATEVGHPTISLWAPLDATGQLNLGGLQEPPENNCARVVLPVPRPGAVGRPPVRPRPIATGYPRTPRPVPVTPTPIAILGKHYTPKSGGEGVAEGLEFAADVSVRILADKPVSNVVACDKWDNRTHSLRDGGVGGVSVWWRGEDGIPYPMDPDGVVVEFARGAWGRLVPEHIPVANRWYTQATSTCEDSAVVAPRGWATADRVDFSNAGGRAIDARDVNMIRARFLEPVPPGTEVWMEVMLRAERNPAGAWLMNYGAAAWGGGRSAWQTEPCHGAYRSGTWMMCPTPSKGTRGSPGPFGDMLV